MIFIGGPVLEVDSREDIRNAHGYSPDKPDYDTVFMIKGPGIKEGFNIGPMELVDIGPSLAELLKLDLGPCDGSCLGEIFSKEKRD